MHADDAQQLFDAERYTNAVHLGGLSVECALKSLICRHFAAEALPDLRVVQRAHSHQLDDLIGLAGVKAELQAQTDADLSFASNWSVVREWSITQRYDILERDASESFLSAALGENGVLPWIKTYW